MDSLVSWGYARRRKHKPVHTNPFKERWREVSGVFMADRKVRPQVGDRVVVVDRSDCNVQYHNMPLGALGTLMYVDKTASFSKPFKVMFDDFRGNAINGGCIWIQEGSIEVY